MRFGMYENTRFTCDPSYPLTSLLMEYQTEASWNNKERFIKRSGYCYSNIYAQPG